MNGFSRVSKNKWKCNRFVADVAIEAGFTVQHNESTHWYNSQDMETTEMFIDR